MKITSARIFSDEERKTIEELLETPKTKNEIKEKLGMKSDGAFYAFLVRCERNYLPIYQDDVPLYSILKKD